MQKIIPHLWFDKNAEEAAEFYVSVFESSSIGKKAYYPKEGFEIHGQPEGQLLSVDFTLAGQSFIGINGGPVFTFNPSISFTIACNSKEEVDGFWQKLSEGGQALMELGEYPFSKWYGWTQDKYGVSWQIMYVGDAAVQQKIVPSIMFVGDVCGRAEEAMQLYTSVFKDSSVGDVARHEASEGPDKPGTILHADFFLNNQKFSAMDSAWDHKFSFNETISFLVDCDTQEEIDYYWDKLSEGGDPSAQQCGWLKDKFGLSWQISPAKLREMTSDSDRDKVERVFAAFMPMKKLDIETLEKAYNG